MKKHFLIIGGNTGIGSELVKQLTSEGHQVTATSRSTDPELVEGVRFLSYDADQNQTLDLPDTLDGLVYCPGTISLKPFERFSDEDFYKDWNINFMGAVKTIRQALPGLKSSGKASIVLFSTVAAQTGMNFHASIASAKGAVEGLTRTLAAEYAPKIRVNAIAPSLTDTPLAQSILSSPERQEASANRHPLKRIGDAAEMARVANFLLSEDSGFITGQILGVDGGIGDLKVI